MKQDQKPSAESGLNREAPGNRRAFLQGAAGGLGAAALSVPQAAQAHRPGTKCELSGIVPKLPPKSITILPCGEPDGYRYWESDGNGGMKGGFLAKLTVGQEVEVTLDKSVRKSKRFWIVEQRPENSGRLGAFRYTNPNECKDRTTSTGVYESSKDGVLRLTAIKGLLPGRGAGGGGLRLSVVVGVDGFPPDDPSVEVDC